MSLLLSAIAAGCDDDDAFGVGSGDGDGDGDGDAGPDAGGNGKLDSGVPVPVEEVGLEHIASGLTSPVQLVEGPNGRLFVVDQIGLVRVITEEGELRSAPFLDLTDRLVDLMPEYDERGLLGFALHPDFEANGRFFVYYSAPLRSGAPAGYDHTARVSEFAVSDEDDDFADPESERVILEVDEPQFNHNGGTLLFGPDDEMLYISLGDGGEANDVGLGHPQIGNGQDRTTLLGSILRIDVSNTSPYSVPQDNPFVGGVGSPEIFAYGFRNPYRMSFDREGDHELFVGDVGQDLWEEIDLVTRGRNYGWNVREGLHCFDPDNPQDSPSECSEEGPYGEPLTDPILEYGHPSVQGGLGIAVVGGFVYRGETVAGLEREYVFGDFSANPAAPAGKLFAATRSGAGAGSWEMRELRLAERSNGDDLDAYLLGLGQDAKGELYALVSQNPGPSGTTGQVYRIVAAPEGEPAADAGVDDGGSADASE